VGQGKTLIVGVVPTRHQLSQPLLLGGPKKAIWPYALNQQHGRKVVG